MTETQLALIPRTVLFGNPERVSPRLSPDAKRLSFIAPLDGVLNVWVGDVRKRDFRPVTRDTERGIRNYFWSEDGKQVLYLQDAGGNENWRLYSVNLTNERTRDLTPYENVQVQILEHNRDFPEEVLIGMNKEDARLHDVYHLHLPTGRMERVARNSGNIAGWLPDAGMKVRGAVASSEDGGFDLLVRSNEDAPWQCILHWNQEDGLASGPICFPKKGNALYLKDCRDWNAARLVRMDLDTSQITVLAEDPRYDVGEAIIHPETYEIQAVAFIKDRDEWLVLDESIRPDIDAIRALHPGDFFLSSRDHADRFWVVGFTADNGPVPYFLFDRSSRKAEFLFYHRPELQQYTLAKTEPIRFMSRDGLPIEGYITFPPQGSRKNLPMVLNVHGGPWHRDTWGFNPEAQWFANRGYVCLQVNFRGSTGYGKVFLNAGDREWGGKMHDDLVDGLNWAVSRGYADPARIGIYGGSYGGYASLVGAVFTPDLFRCAVSIVGPSNLITFIQTVPPYWSTFLTTLHKRVGNPETEPEFLKSRSPLFHVDQIKIPMLIAQGANDPRVKQAESEQIVQAMRDRGIEHEYMLFPDEGHGFAKPENRLRFYVAAEKFLARHLGGRFEA